MKFSARFSGKAAFWRLVVSMKKQVKWLVIFFVVSFAGLAVAVDPPRGSDNPPRPGTGGGCKSVVVRHVTGC